MTKIVFSVFLTGFLLLCFSQNREDWTWQRKEYREAERIFREAERLSTLANDSEYLLAKADEVYATALKVYKNLAATAEKTGNDSLAFLTRCRTGFISYLLNDPETARKEWLAVFALKQKLPSVPDSLLFIPFLYTGGIYHSLNQFDSAIYFYKKAETINDSYQKPLLESERLYNRLGVMYYENGNYRQARNYFEKAITLTNPSATGLLINYRVNIASLLVKLEDYPNAKTAYESLLSNKVFPDEINHNLGIINMKLDDFNTAISFLRKVNYTNSKKIIDLYYNFGEAWSGLKEADSSTLYIQKAIAENTRWNGHKKNVSYGLILNFQAGELVTKQQYSQAIDLYQQAIMQFDAGFNEPDISKNPEEFSGVFSYINLFNTLVAKADALELLYQEQKEIRFLDLSFAAYRSAFKLADYVEKTYDSDEARLFLGKIKYTAHSKPIDVSLLLYDLTQKKDYLEGAYHFDQQNKASVLALNVQENELKNDSRFYKELLEKEASLKAAITRQSLKAARLTDSLQLQSVNSSIRDDEIRLGKVQDEMNNDPVFRSRYFTSRIPGIKELQKKLDKTTALLSWHLSDKDLVVFIITGNRFTYYHSPLSPDFIKNIDSFKTMLNNTSTDQKYNGAEVSTALYQSLMAPVEPKLTNIDHLVIIPDDELNYLPFEALQDKKGRYLVEKFSIQYQYSTALPGKNDKTRKATGTLAFAPFASGGYADSSGNHFSVLPASREETSGLTGKLFTDSSAKKINFLPAANHYGIIHLATHASVDNEMPLRSFIAFYPSPGSRAENFKLYFQEISNLKLDSVDLVILSACETGSGKLVKGEGMMSLSRAFAYAGCSNIIASLWKAEDKTTSFITRQLHSYLRKGYTKARALQKAKIDLLHNNEMIPSLKSPNYWSHLIFIGDYESSDPSGVPTWLVMAIGLFVSVILYLSQRIIPADKKTGNKKIIL